MRKMVACLEFNVPDGDDAAEMLRQALEHVSKTLEPKPVDVMAFLGDPAATRVLDFLWAEVQG